MNKMWNSVGYEQAGEETGKKVIPFHKVLLDKCLLSAA